MTKPTQPTDKPTDTSFGGEGGPPEPEKKTLPIEALERVHRVCQKFEEAWKKGERPRIEAFVGAAEGEERSQLLRELILLDLDYRHRADESPQPLEYRRRFPDAARVLDDISFTREAALPKRIGPYDVLQLLGEGGMGAVYLAEQTAPVRRRVALKVIKLGMDTKEVIARFEAERQALAMMSHPNIARVYDAGATPAATDGGAGGGRPYFVMEHIPGEPIDRYSDRHRLSTRERLELFRQVCDAVQHAHQKAIIHRDIKPSNVLVMLQDGQPVPKIIDFGVARATNQRLTEKTIFTEQGQIIGTPEYMSPEQAEMTGVDIDTRTDIYSLGVLLYELLVGALPFDSRSLRQAGFAEMQRIIREVDPPKPSTRLSELGDTPVAAEKRQTDPRALVRQIRGDLDWITMKALEKDRTRRYSSASELAAEISRYLNQEPVLAGPPGLGYRIGKYVRRHRAMVVSASSIILLLVAGMAVSLKMYFRAEDARGRLAANETELEATVKELRQTVSQRDAALDQQERDLAAIQGLTLCAQSGTVLSSDPGLALRLAFEGARRAPGLLANNALVAALEKNQERMRLIGSEAVVQWAAFSPDGLRVLTAARDSVRIWDSASGEVLFTFREKNEDVLFRYTAFNPAGSRILIPKSQRVTIRETLGGKVALEWDVKEYLEAAAFTPDGLRVFLVAGGKGRVHHAVTGERLFTLDAKLDQTGAAPLFDVQGDRILATVAENEKQKIAIWDLATRKRRALLDCPEGIHSATLSRDATRVAFLASDGTVRVATVDMGSDPSALESVPEARGVLHYDSVVFSPDGSKAAATIQEQLLVWNVDDGRLSWKLRERALQGPLTFSPDGRRIFAGGRIWDASTGHLLLALEGRRGSFSPDGRRVVTFPSMTPRIWNGAPEESFPVEIREGTISSSTMSPAGDKALTVSAGGKVRLWDTGQQEILAELTGRFAAFSPDGSHLVNVPAKGRAQVWVVAHEHAENLGDWRLGDWRLSYGEGWVVGEKENNFKSALFGPRGRRLLLWREDGAAELWDLEREAEEEEQEEEEEEEEETDFDRDAPFRRPWGPLGRKVLTLDSKQGAAAAFFGPGGRQVITVTGRRIGMGAAQGYWARVSSWDTATGEKVVDLAVSLDRSFPERRSRRKAKRTDYARRVRLSPDGRWLLAMGGNVATVHDWARIRSESEMRLAVRKGNQRRREFREAISQNVPQLHVEDEGDPESRSSRTTLVEFPFDIVRWEANPRPPGRSSPYRVELSGHGDDIRDAAFSPDGKRAATASDDGTVRIWDVRRARELFSLRGHSDAVFAVTFSANGKLVLTTSADGTARVWDAATGSERLTLGRPEAAVARAAFAPDGEHVLTHSGGGKVRLWPVDVMAAAEERVPGGFTPQERERFAIDRLAGGNDTSMQDTPRKGTN